MSRTSCVPHAPHRTVSVLLLLWFAWRVSLVLNRASMSINLWEDISAQGRVCLLSANKIAELPPGEDVSIATFDQMFPCYRIQILSFYFTRQIIYSGNISTLQKWFSY